ncbi:MAG TPA: hypothetical protein VKA70_11705 [Blastocatellia bacterium]|nr:hypothetical protein [Blastocatellia bacterium]
MQLEKAKIAELDDQNRVKGEFPVQFNPTSLRLQITNAIEGGNSAGRQVRQYIGSSSTTLTLDLIFDTADEGTTDNPLSVREKTKQIERFLQPKGKENGKFVAPRIRFRWNDLTFDGLVDSLTIDLDYFAANGAPLRAKVTLAIKEQNRDLELLISGPGANRQANVPAPGRSSAAGLGGGIGASAGLGFSASASLGFSASASVGVALGGESAAEFSARVGLDPAAWRGLDFGGESSLSFSAGVEIGFDAGISASAGLGVTVGLEAGISSSLEASFGLEASAGLNAVSGVGVGAGLASGFALSAAGGVSAAIESVQQIKNQTAESQARQAFKAPQKSLPATSAATPTTGAQATVAAPNITSAASRQPAAPAQSRTPLSLSGAPSQSAQQSAPPAPRPVVADPRASSFGFGVPLRQALGEAAKSRGSSIRGQVAIRSKIASGDPPMTADPTKPPWVALPARDRARNAADKIQKKTRPARPCGCSSRCKH